MSLFDTAHFDLLLRTAWLARNVEYFQSVETTMTIARELAALGAPTGTLVLAEEQTAGRGRRGRSFASPPGENLYFTLILRLSRQMVRALPLALPLAVCEGILASGPDARIKWPNDIWVRDRKLSGMLTDLDTAGDDYIAFPGVGINVNGDPRLVPGLEDTATSIAVELGHPVDRVAVLAHVCNTLEAALQAPPQALAERYRAVSFVLGHKVTVSGAGPDRTGTAVAILDDGNLVLRLADGSEETISAGDVSLRPATGPG